MPTNASVKRILSAREEDNSKVLGIVVNGKAITTKQWWVVSKVFGVSSNEEHLVSLRDAKTDDFD